MRLTKRFLPVFALLATLVGDTAIGQIGGIDPVPPQVSTSGAKKRDRTTPSPNPGPINNKTIGGSPGTGGGSGS